MKRIFRLYIVSFLLLGMHAVLFSEDLINNEHAKEEWIRLQECGHTSNAGTKGIVLDQSGNVYVGGSVSEYYGTDFLVMKYNASGNQEWAKIFNGPAQRSDVLHAIQSDNSGYIYVFGSSDVTDGQYATVKYNSSNEQQWASYFDYVQGEYGASWGRDLFVDAGGNVYVTGNCMGREYPVIGPDYDMVTVKYNSNGVQQWFAGYDGSTRGSVTIAIDDYGYSVAADASGNVYAVGSSNEDIITIKYNSQGAQQWAKKYSGPVGSFDQPVGIAVDSNGNAYVVGTIGRYGQNSSIAFIKYDASGKEVWAKSYDSPKGDYANDMLLDSSGNLYVCGYSEGICIFKYSADGVELWSVINDTVCSMANAIAIDASGNVYVTGYANDWKTSVYYDFMTVKYSHSGQKIWSVSYNNGFDTAEDIVVGGDGSVYITGDTDDNIVTIKYSQTTETSIDGCAGLPSDFKFYQNYPNPFNPFTTVGFQLPSSVFVSVSIFDLAGKKVAVLADRQYNPGIYNLTWDSSGFPSGVYYCRIQAGQYSETTKMILLR